MRRCWRILGLRLEKSRLQVEDVFAELVILVLQGLVVVFHGLELFDLLLEFLDVAFFALTECTLRICQSRLKSQ